MIGWPTYNKFIVYFPKDFITSGVENMFDGYRYVSDLPFDHLVDYVNSTITNIRISGLQASLSRDQIRKRGKEIQSRNTPVNNKKNINRDIRISMLHKNSFLNWFIMRNIIMETLGETDDKEESDIIFFPDIYGHIKDDHGRIICDIIFKEVHFQSLDELNLKKSEITSNVGNTFDVVFKWNKLEISPKFDKFINYRNEKDHVY